jgi:hypothetical protein
MNHVIATSLPGIFLTPTSASASRMVSCCS